MSSAHVSHKQSQMKQSITFNISLSSNFTLKTLLNSQVNLNSRPPTTKSLTFLVLCSSQPQQQQQQPSKSLTLISLLRAIPDWADGVKERGMQQKRSLYSHEKWVEHRSSLRHVRHLLSSLSSRVILSLIPPVFAFTLFAVAIASYNTAVDTHLLPGFFPVLRASSLPYQLTAPALALLLVFRTEASYSRYEQGRKAWTKILYGTDDLARLLISGLDFSASSPDDLFIKDVLLRYVMAFPVALKCHVIYGSDFGEDLKPLLDGDELAVVLNSKHRPRCIIGFISQSLKLLKLDEAKRNILESKVSCFIEGIGECENLMGIPIPLSYTRLTSRFLVLWHFTLPIILWDDCHWITVPATFISAASLFCIEEVGVLIEEPFPVLALDELCKLVHRHIKEAIATQAVIKTRVISKRKSHHCEQEQEHEHEHSPNGWPNS